MFVEMVKNVKSTIVIEEITLLGDTDTTETSIVEMEDITVSELLNSDQSASN